MATDNTPTQTNDHADTPEFDSIPSAIESFSRGNFLIVLDAPTRENEGDLIIAASHLTPRKAAFMIRYTSGYLCAPMPSTLADSLDLQPMIPLSSNSDPRRTCYTVSVDAVGAGTGISAESRSRTCRALGAAGARADGFVRPGHVLPLRAVDGGVRERQGHTEAAVEICRLAGCGEVGVIGELVEDGEDAWSAGEDGKRPGSRTGSGPGLDIRTGIGERSGTGMMRRDQCLAFGRRFGIKVITIEDLLVYVRTHPKEKAG